jgi:hypothetical protein
VTTIDNGFWPCDPSTFYAGAALGYTDYPTVEQTA